jgi:PAS domain S-box-containing protein
MQSTDSDADATSKRKGIRILHLEDSKADAQLIRHKVEEEGLGCDITHVGTKSRFEAELGERQFDLILSDYGLPGYDGFAALRFARKTQPQVPFIMLSGSLDDAQAVQSLQSGAADYILKQRLACLVPAICRALREAEERKRQREADERIREQANLLDLTGDAIIVRTVEDRILFWNKGAEMIFGWSREEAVGQEFAMLHGDEYALAQAKVILLGSEDWMGEVPLKAKSGEDIIVFSRWHLMRDASGQPHAILSANTDITEKKKLETIALRAQRMDSIGSLAGGIAHDLNNALAPVLMSVELIRSSPEEASRERFLGVITSSAERATSLVKQILGFARGHNGTGPVHVTSLIREMAKIVRDTFPKSILISVNLADYDLWQIQGDATELHQVLLNLCVNARDAMPNGGRLSISAQNLWLDEVAGKPMNAPPGAYLLLSVADTGSGIPPEVQPRIFEPFYTTKAPDKGTGLGLSTVATIVKHHAGFIGIKTELGQGTEFKIYLPACEAAAEAVETKSPEVALPAGHGELILVIDDEEAVCELIKTTLENYGYRVVTAQNGMQGLARFEEHKDSIRVLVTDTDMPYMDGLKTVDAIKELKPDIPVIISSGSKRETDQTRKNGAEHPTNLGKPFTVDQLLIAVGLAVRT